MKRELKDYFLPHKGNDHKPHFLHGTSLFILFAGIVLVSLFALSSLGNPARLSLLGEVYSSLLVDLTNQDRVDHGKHVLMYDTQLTQVAQNKANDMAEKGYFAHTSPEGVTPWDWFRDAEYDFVHAGENLAVNFVESIEVERAWMASPTHRANILNNKFTHVGIATAKGQYKGKSATFVVQMFATPAPEIPLVPVPEVVIEETPKPVISQESPSELESLVAGEFTTLALVPPTEVPEYTETSSDERKVGKHPSRTALVIYIILFILIAGTLIAMVVVNVRKQYPKNIILSLLLLGILVVLFFAHRLLLDRSVIISPEASETTTLDIEV